MHVSMVVYQVAALSDGEVSELLRGTVAALACRAAGGAGDGDAPGSKSVEAEGGPAVGSEAVRVVLGCAHGRSPLFLRLVAEEIVRRGSGDFLAAPRAGGARDAGERLNAGEPPNAGAPRKAGERRNAGEPWDAGADDPVGRLFPGRVDTLFDLLLGLAGHGGGGQGRAVEVVVTAIYCSHAGLFRGQILQLLAEALGAGAPAAATVQVWEGLKRSALSSLVRLEPPRGGGGGGGRRARATGMPFSARPSCTCRRATPLRAGFWPRRRRGQARTAGWRSISGAGRRAPAG